LPVERPNGTVIDASFPALLEGGLMSFAAPALGVQSFWSGSNKDGSLATNNCAGWTVGDGSEGGANGSLIATDDSWLFKGGWVCGGDFPLVCLCW
jgi:hypothetical protein